MKNWKVLAGSMVLAGALAAPGISMAFGGGDHHGGPPHFKHRMFERLADELALTEGQKAQLKANREAGRQAHEDQRGKRHELHKQLREAIEAGADQATLDQLGAQLGKLEVSQMQAMAQQRKQFEAILTDEQKAKLEELKAERRARWQEHREKRAARSMKDE
ncbi:Spy/CpxP family protein refolding chaperone [Microbulbifer litoralis]|uniref:Spy/CpxP family protein refolding chaperone n=1 Tax=Microbulbifer litoralis TaxID=2933965 RepID=UPI002028A5A7|nr:Spy/CpxP family protein refolding chaperone [Microbulbifer sp. GX H0434]